MPDARADSARRGLDRHEGPGAGYRGAVSFNQSSANGPIPAGAPDRLSLLPTPTTPAGKCGTSMAIRRRPRDGACSAGQFIARQLDPVLRSRGVRPGSAGPGRAPGRSQVGARRRGHRGQLGSPRAAQRQVDAAAPAQRMHAFLDGQHTVEEPPRRSAPHQHVAVRERQALRRIAARGAAEQEHGGQTE